MNNESNEERNSILEELRHIAEVRNENEKGMETLNRKENFDLNKYLRMKGKIMVLDERLCRYCWR